MTGKYFEKKIQCNVFMCIKLVPQKKKPILRIYLTTFSISENLNNLFNFNIRKFDSEHFDDY